METGKRRSDIELLRIISMIMIIAHHFVVHGGIEFGSSDFCANRIWAQFMQMGGKIGANIFVLISGYFLVSSPGIKLKKALKLWFEIFFYSVLFFCVFTFSGENDFDTVMLLKSLFPVSHGLWWFAAAYFFMYLLSPYINILIKGLKQAEYRRMLLLGTVMWCVIPTVFENTKMQACYLLWFVYLYCLAGYLRLYEADFKKYSRRFFLSAAVIIILLTLLLSVILDIIGLRYENISAYATYLFDMDKLPMLLAAVFMFMGFNGLGIKYSRLINTAASAAFGVYLIHDHVYARKFMWEKIFHTASYMQSPYFIPYSIFCIAAVYLVCALIELLRINLRKH